MRLHGTALAKGFGVGFSWQSTLPPTQLVPADHACWGRPLAAGQDFTSFLGLAEKVVDKNRGFTV